MDGIHRLVEELDGAFCLIISDKTGTYPGDRGLGERLAFLYRTSSVELWEVVSDITYDRTKVTQIIFENLEAINKIKKEYDDDMRDYQNKRRKTKPKLNPPTFLF